ncbi:MAG: BrnT family toxin [Leptospiraceae bacterium]|nr:BrnT family toxin [Leptospiraceae bacterium]
MIHFEWDENKNIANQKKHGISFEEAAYVFSDKENISIPDLEHSQNEDRWITIGTIKRYGIVIVVHTERIYGKQSRIRIISARKAVETEERDYLESLGGK